MSTDKPKFSKYQLSTDVFSNKMEAESRAIDMGFGQVSHAYEVDGQAYYMPASSHEAYMSYFSEANDPEPTYPSPDKMEVMTEALSAVVDAIMESVMKVNKEDTFEVIKFDEEQRIIYGWASVTTHKGEVVIDGEGEWFRTETLHKAVNEFMKGLRVGKLNHSGDPKGQIVHSFPISKEICDALGIQSDNEGWITGYYVEDDELWADVKLGKYAELSIGGTAEKVEE
jgi:hypothetical protein